MRKGPRGVRGHAGGTRPHHPENALGAGEEVAAIPACRSPDGRTGGPASGFRAIRSIGEAGSRCSAPQAHRKPTQPRPHATGTESSFHCRTGNLQGISGESGGIRATSARKGKQVEPFGGKFPADRSRELYVDNKEGPTECRENAPADGAWRSSSRLHGKPEPRRGSRMITRKKNPTMSRHEQTLAANGRCKRNPTSIAGAA